MIEKIATALKTIALKRLIYQPFSAELERICVSLVPLCHKVIEKIALLMWYADDC